jgi:hypothetical protein
VQKLQDLLWLWMVLGFTILPAIRQAMVQIKRKVIIAKIERKRGTKVITQTASSYT